VGERLAIERGKREVHDEQITLDAREGSFRGSSS
jgi:hypothetical protein